MLRASAAQASLLENACVPQTVTSWPASLVNSFAALARIASSEAVIAGADNGGTRPAGAAGAPVVLFVHGGAFLRGALTQKNSAEKNPP